jgi:AcrR family transcriptional regulator
MGNTGGGRSGGAGALAIGRAGIAERLAARRTEIEEAIFTRVNDTSLGGVGSDDPEYVQGLRLTVGALVNYSLLAIDRGGRGPGAVPRAAVAQARRAACGGVQLGTVLRRYIAGQALLEDFVIQEATHGDFLGERAALRGVLETSSLLLDRLLPSIAAAYTEELAQASRSRWQRGAIVAAAAPPASADSTSTLLAFATPAQLAPAEPAATEDLRAGSIEPIEPIALGAGLAFSREPAIDQRRARILQTMVEVVAERGYAGVSVELVAERARVGRDTFHGLFPDLASCFDVVLDIGLSRALEMIGAAFECERSWLTGTRTALASLLGFLDSEPLLARVWLVESLTAGPTALERRERNLTRLRERVLALWPEPEAKGPPPLAVEGLVGSVLGVMHTHLVMQEAGPLIELLGPLMGMIVRPYLGVERAEREIERARRLVREIQAAAPPPAFGGPAGAGVSTTGAGVGTDVGVPAMLSNPRAHRLRECFLFVVAHSQSCNREIAVGVGIAHDSQVSKLLSDLLAEGLLVKRSDGVGKRNVWSATPRGELVSRLLLG